MSQQKFPGDRPGIEALVQATLGLEPLAATDPGAKHLLQALEELVTGLYGRCAYSDQLFGGPRAGRQSSPGSGSGSGSGEDASAGPGYPHQ